MNTAYYIARRLAFSPQKSIARFIIRLAMAATALSVAAMIITLGFVNGFQQKVSDKVYSFWGHIRVQQFTPGSAMISEELMVTRDPQVERILLSEKRIESVRKFATKSAVVSYKGEIEGVLLKGLEKGYSFHRMASFLKSGRWPYFQDSSYSRDLVLSEHTANQLQIRLNDTVRLVFIDPVSGLGSARKMFVCGLFRTGIEQYDHLFAIGDLRLIQRVNGWENNEFGGYEVFVKETAAINGLNDSLYARMPQNWVSRTMQELFPNIFDWLGVLNMNRNVIFTVMSIVAVINLLTCLLILVLERTRMIGVLKSIGASNLMVQKIFILHAGFVGFFGIIAGLFLGLGICFLQDATGFISLPEAQYYIDRAEVKIVWWQVAAVCAGTLMVCLISLIAPSLIVRTIQPARAVQFR